MNKTMRAVVVLCALFACLVLAGCGDKARLDRAVTVDGLSMSVPSQWVEKANMRDVGKTSYDFTSELGFIPQQRNEEGRYDAISILSYGGAYDNYTLEDWLEREKDATLKAPMNGYDYRVNMLGETVIDGAKVVKYDISYKCETNGKAEAPYEYHYAWITRPNVTYIILVFGDSVSMDDLLSTVHIG